MKKFIAVTILLQLIVVLSASAKVKKTHWINYDDTLKVSILGDSYSTFEGCVTPDTNFVWYWKENSPGRDRNNNVCMKEQTWWYQLIQRMRVKLETNNSFSGSTICYTGYKSKETGEHQDYSDRAFITRSNKLGNPDLILVCGATNDSWAGAPVGEYVFGNWTKEQLYFFRPAMAKLLYDLKGNYPTASILFILNTDLRPEINESVHTICKHYDVDCLDLHDIEKQDGHPSIKGMQAFVDQVGDFLSKMK